MTSPRQALPIAVLISGRGSNLQAIIDAVARGELAADIRLVLSNRAGAQGLERARAAGIATAVIESAGHGDRAAYDRALRECLDASGARLVVLAGFMRVLSPEFVRHYQGRLINIHPSLLPAFTGLHTHRRALAEGVAEHGASVHFVTPVLDDGPVLMQVRIPVLPDDTAESLAARLLPQEHRLLVAAVRLIAQGRVRLQGEQILVDGEALRAPM